MRGDCCQCSWEFCGLKSCGVNPSYLSPTTSCILAGAYCDRQHLCRALLKFLINEFQRQPAICGTCHKICCTKRINFISLTLQWPGKVRELESPLWMMGEMGVCLSDTDALETQLLLLLTNVSHKLSVSQGTEKPGRFFLKNYLLVVCASVSFSKK